MRTLAGAGPFVAYTPDAFALSLYANTRKGYPPGSWILAPDSLALTPVGL